MAEKSLLQYEVEHRRGVVLVQALVYGCRVVELRAVVHVGVDGAQSQLFFHEDVDQGLIHVGEVWISANVESL